MNGTTSRPARVTSHGSWRTAPGRPPSTTGRGSSPRRRGQPAQTGLAACDYLERLPEGAVSLDLEGRITFLTTDAARLLGRRTEQLLGTRPWQSLPWLDDPVYEDHYRTAVVSRVPVTYAACRPRTSG
ncbi:PAS domain-containing protein [Streptomyces sp. INA 01156]